MNCYKEYCLTSPSQQDNCDNNEKKLHRKINYMQFCFLFLTIKNYGCQ